MSKFITQTEVKNISKAIKIAEQNGCNVYGYYRLTANEYVISGDLHGIGDFWFVDSCTNAFRAATAKEYDTATA